MRLITPFINPLCGFLTENFNAQNSLSGNAYKEQLPSPTPPLLGDGVGRGAETVSI